MPTATTPDISDTLRQTRDQLLDPIPDLNTVLKLLCLPLDLLGLLHSSLYPYRDVALGEDVLETASLIRWIPTLQDAVLNHVLIDWQDALQQAGYYDRTIEALFCPRDSRSTNACLVAWCSYDVLLASMSQRGADGPPPKMPKGIVSFAIRMLGRLSTEFPVDALHRGIFDLRVPASRQQQLWEDCVRNLAAAPAKVANSCERVRERVPDMLMPSAWFVPLCTRSEILLYGAAKSSMSEQQMSSLLDSLSTLFNKLVRIGLVPIEKADSPATPSFFAVTLPTIKRRILAAIDTPAAAASMSYSFLWRRLLSHMAAMDSQHVIRSLLGHLDLPPSLSTSPSSRQSVKKSAVLLKSLVGSLSRTSDVDRERWDVVVAVALQSPRNEWDVGLARVMVCWISGLATGSQLDVSSLDCLIQSVLQVWADPSFIKFSLIARHKYITSFLLFTIAYLPRSSRPLTFLATNPVFIAGVGAYMNHVDPTVRTLGLLVAEVISAATSTGGRALDFGPDIWEGEGEGREFVRELRLLIKSRDGDSHVIHDDPEADLMDDDTVSSPTTNSGHRALPKVSSPVIPRDGYDSDDSLTGYSTSGGASRSTSPTPSDLDEIEKDPLLNNPQKKKVSKPVYLSDLGNLLRDSQDAEKLDVALSAAEDLIRRKKDYGTELEENAVDLTISVLQLNDDFNLDEFGNRQQRSLVALVACCPQKAAPCIIEKFFHHQYSVTQRSTMLTALALGSRELAGLDVDSSKQVAFPSQILPAAQHRKYIAQQGGDQVESVLRGITSRVIDKQASNAEDTVPALAREKQLRIRKAGFRPVVELDAFGRAPLVRTAYKDIAAEYFIMPFINRFWRYFRDEQTREERTALSASRYRGAGTAMILSPAMLRSILATLAVLMHAARHSPAYLAVLSPETLELAATVGTRSMSTSLARTETDNQQAAVLSAALDLALVVLDGCLELDSGRTLAFDHATLVSGVSEWAAEVFGKEEKGLRVEGAAGLDEGRLQRAAAAVVLKVDALFDKWRGAMITGL